MNSFRLILLLKDKLPNFDCSANLGEDELAVNYLRLIAKLGNCLMWRCGVLRRVALIALQDEQRSWLRQRARAGMMFLV